MNFHYTHRIQFHASHGYYADGKCRDFTWVPTEETRSLLHNRHALFRSHETGFTVLAGSNGSTTPFLLDPGEKLVLTFWMQLTKSTFLNFTDLPLTYRKPALYTFSNDTPDEQGNLATGAFVSGLDQLQHRNMAFTVSVPQEAAVPLAVTDQWGQQVWATEVDGTELSDTWVDLHMQPPGKYTLQVGDQEPETFYASPATIAPLAFGVLTLVIDETVLQQLAAQQHELAYHVSFQPRATFWNYYIVAGDESATGEASIREEDEVAEVFDGPTTVAVRAEKEALQFTSNRPLPLAERPDQSYTLFYRPTGNGNGMRSLRVPLPVPGDEHIRPTPASEESKIFSDIYVYL